MHVQPVRAGAQTREMGCYSCATATATMGARPGVDGSEVYYAGYFVVASGYDVTD